MLFDALILLEVLSDHMNVTLAKHVDLTLPFDRLIEVNKDIKLLLLIPSNVKLAQLHGVHIYNSQESGVFFL
jgi:hypothetical protein